jgi:formamidopyrimidine-DNA glycosylase
VLHVHGCASLPPKPMPELPEVETVRRGLVDYLVGRRAERVEVGRLRTVRRTSARAVIDGLTGTTMTSVDRRGKYLVCQLDSGDAVMIHLRMSGQVLVARGGSERPAHTHVAVTMSDGFEWWFVDPRTFGEVVVFDPTNVAVEVPELAKLGIDPVADRFERRDLVPLLARKQRLKPLLLDQHVIAGLGNIYTDESLHRARIHPFRQADSLSGAEITRLHAAIVSILAEAIDAGGSTLSDAQYVSLTGELGTYQNDHGAYGRTGQPCHVCGKGVINRVMLGGRSTHFCPRCQPVRAT